MLGGYYVASRQGHHGVNALEQSSVLLEQSEGCFQISAGFQCLGGINPALSVPGSVV